MINEPTENSMVKVILEVVIKNHRLLLIQDNVHYNQNIGWSIHYAIFLQITFTS